MTEPTVFSRRTLTKLAVLALPGIALAPRLRARSLDIERLQDPVFNVRAFARLAATLEPDHAAYVHYRGKAFGVDGTGPQQALYGIEGLAALRASAQQNGSVRFLFNEAAIYTDLDTGEPLERWRNPYTEEIVSVWHQRNGPVNFALSPTTRGEVGKFRDDAASSGFRLPWRIEGDVATFAQDVTSARQNPIDALRYPEYSTGEILHISEHTQYWVRLADLLDPEVRSLEYEAALQSLKPWHPWMRMGLRPGRVFTRMTAQKVPGTSWLSPAVREFAIAELGDYLTPPQHWTGEYVDAYTLFSRELDARRDDPGTK